MRVAVLHYHLHTGGVTRIIQHAVTELASQGISTVVLTGEQPEGHWNVPVQVISGLGYEEQRKPLSPEELVKELESVTQETLGGLPDVWHIHNHSLGKNLALPKTLCLLALAGHRLLLQIHDFPEDGRPVNYRRLLEFVGRGDISRLSSYLYPQAAHIHYAVLNGRDLNIMSAAGLSGAQLHLLPNPVQMHNSVSDLVGSVESGIPTSRLWLYPTRAIRRKNIGEFLLWAAMADPEERFATTQGPKNPAERPRYEHWQRLARVLDLAVEFEIGTTGAASFEALLRSARALVTTSVAEGFGMAFLEPWLVDRSVVGRNLPEITSEFTHAGVEFPNLYERVEIPVNWIGRDVLERSAYQGLSSMISAYARTPKADDLQRVLSAWIRDGYVDFGRLDEPLQENIIRRVVDSAAEREQILPNRLSPPETHSDHIERNKASVLRNFSVTHYGESLLEIFHQILNSPVEPLEAFSGDALLDQFLAPERLFLLRS